MNPAEHAFAGVVAKTKIAMGSFLHAAYTPWQTQSKPKEKRTDHLRTK